MREAGLRSRWSGWPTTASMVGVIIAGGAAAVLKWPHAWWWLVVVVVAAAAVASPALAAFTEASRRRQERQRAVRAELQGTTGPHGSKLPDAAVADLERRVNPAVLPIPYIRRDIEDTIRTHLHAGHPVLLVGSSMVGKTKMAAHIIVEEFGSWPVAILNTKTALATLDAQDVSLHGTVIWLDDIDRLIDDPCVITDGDLRRLAAAGNLIVGTIRARAYEQFLPSDELRRVQWDVVSAFERVFVDRGLTEEEEKRLAEAVDDAAIRNRIRSVGLGEYVGAAQHVDDMLKLGAAGTEPLGYALVLAAADWRRCGMVRPISASLLAQLAEPHLDQRGRARISDKDAFNAGLDWAIRPINPNVSLLQPAGVDCYVVYDYALDLISAHEKPIPDSSWEVIMHNANVSELASIGYIANVIYHRRDLAIKAFHRAASSPDAGPVVVYNLGLLLARRGVMESAKDAYQSGIDSGDSEVAPRAANNLGILLERQGDLQGAKDAYQKAIDSRHPEAAARALGNLGLLLANEGDVQGAKDAYQRDMHSGHPELAARAALNLGLLLARHGDMEDAKDAYQQAFDSKDSEAVPIAALNLGLILEEQGDMVGAKDAYQRAIDSGDSKAAAEAAINLGRLLKDQT